MWEWLYQNIATILTCIFVAVVIALSIWNTVRSKRSGCGGCAGCSAAGYCPYGKDPSKNKSGKKL
jgi:hypothetical protein